MGNRGIIELGILLIIVGVGAYIYPQTETFLFIEYTTYPYREYGEFLFIIGLVTTLIGAYTGSNEDIPKHKSKNSRLIKISDDINIYVKFYPSTHKVELFNNYEKIAKFSGTFGGQRTILIDGKSIDIRYKVRSIGPNELFLSVDGKMISIEEFR